MKRSFTLFVTFVAIFCATVLLNHSTIAQDSTRTVDVTASRFVYAPNDITLKKNQPVVLVLKGIDANHGLRFRELNLEIKVKKGGTAEMRFTPDKTGDFVGQCSVFCGSGHGGMKLTLHVVD